MDTYWLRNILFRFIIQIITGACHGEQVKKKETAKIEKRKQKITLFEKVCAAKFQIVAISWPCIRFSSFSDIILNSDWVELYFVDFVNKMPRDQNNRTFSPRDHQHCQNLRNKTVARICKNFHSGSSGYKVRDKRRWRFEQISHLIAMQSNSFT